MNFKINWKMSWKKYLSIGLAFFFIFLINNIPVQLVVSLAKSVAPAQMNQLRLYGARGSIWQGQFDRIDISGRSLHAVNWDLNVFALLVGTVSADVALRINDQPLEAVVSRGLLGSIELNDVRGKIDAQQLVQLAKLPAIKLDGDFLLNLDQISIEDNRLDGLQGRIVWSGAETRFPQRLLLGDLSAIMSNEDEGIVIQLKDGGGPLQLDARIVLDEEDNYTLSGKMMARDGRQSLLGRSLGMLGSMDGQGNVNLNMKGNLKQFGFLTR